MKKLRIITSTLFFCMICTYAQEARLDSMLRVVKTQADDTVKINTLGKIFVMQLYMDPVAAKEHPLAIMELSEKIGYEAGITRAYLYLGNYYYTLKHQDSAEYYLKECIRLADKPNEHKLKANALASLGAIASDRGDYKRAIQIMDSVSKVYLELDDYLFYGASIGDIGLSYYQMGDYSKASEKTFEALEILDTITKQPVHKADLLRRMGHINNAQGSHEKALDYYQQALEIYNAASDYLYQVYILNDIGIVEWDLERHNEALKYFEKSLALSLKYNYPEMVGNCYSNIGSLYTDMGEYQKALPYELKGFEQLQQTGTMSSIVTTYSTVGDLYSRLGKHSQAMEYLDRGVHLADSTKALDQLSHAFLTRAKAYERVGDLRKALEDRKGYEMYKDSLFTKQKTEEIERLQAEFETAKKEAALALQEEEIKNLNQAVEISNLKTGLFAGGMASFVAISGLLFFGFRQRIKKNRIAREKQEEIYRQEIEYKKKELASQTLHLVQKNTFLQELKENIEKIKKSPELFKVEFRRLTMLLKRQTAEDKDWEVFKSYFADVHDNFDNKLRTLHKNITDKEIRLAAFLRMDLSTKEIAAMLNVIPTSILTSKYRLKKKLGLDKEVDLGSFLKTL